MKRTLITPEEAAALASIEIPGNKKELIDVPMILVAQASLLKAPLGGLYDSMLEGCYYDFVTDYIKLPLALWIKSIAIRQRAVSLTNAGVVRDSGGYVRPASLAEMASVSATLRSQALLLLGHTIEHINRNRLDFPEYTPMRRRKLKRLLGGMII